MGTSKESLYTVLDNNGNKIWSNTFTLDKMMKDVPKLGIWQSQTM